MVESLVVAVLLAFILTEVAHVSRLRFRQAGDTFRCRLRTCGYSSAIWPCLRPWWSRRMWAMWVDDVLVVRRGPVLARTVLLRARITRSNVSIVSVREVRRLGPDPIAIALDLWDGSMIEIAAEEEARLILAGPFIAAAVSALANASMPRRRP
jgi:hypothetical protein